MKNLWKKILFIGNSFTRRNDLVGTIKSLDRTTNALDIYECTMGGASWWRHVRDSAHCITANAHWDVVVLQEQSNIMLHPNYNLDPATTLAQMIRENNPDTSIMLFETWPYQNGWSNKYNREEMRAILQAKYLQVGELINAEQVVLVGDAVTYVSNSVGAGNSMWDWDGRHPSKDTTYLAACMFYQTLTGFLPDITDDDKKRFLQDVSSLFLKTI